MDQLRTPASVTRYVNVFHIDHNENKLSIWRASLPEALAEFLSKRATLPNYYFHNGKTNVPRHCVGRTLEYDNGESCVTNSAKPFATPLMPAAMDT